MKKNKKDLTVKVSAKSDNRFKIREFSKFKLIRIMGILELATLPVSVT